MRNDMEITEYLESSNDMEITEYLESSMEEVRQLVLKYDSQTIQRNLDFIRLTCPKMKVTITRVDLPCTEVENV